MARRLLFDEYVHEIKHAVLEMGCFSLGIDI